MSDRIKNARTILDDRRLDAMLVTLPANRFYLSGFPNDDDGPDESSGVLLIDRAAATLLTGATNAGWATDAARPGVNVVSWERPWERFVGERIARQGWANIGFEDEALTVASHREIAAAAGPSLGWVPLGGAVSQLRSVKDAGELAIIERAIQLTDAAFEAASARLEEGWTERRLARVIDDELRALGTEGPAFGTIVASGPHAARPHHEPGERTITAGEPVIIDMGGRLSGYAADLTRTIWLGEATPKLLDVYTVVLRAQLAAVAAIRPGVIGKDADAVVRDLFESTDHGEHFPHGLGHGVGIRIHEAPSLGKHSDDVLAVGQVVTIEPGIYLDGWGGVRIEDVVHVERDGCRVLTRAPKSMIAGTVGE